jgi:Holliday junction resolvasome RuvABC endonuclease subunit
MRIIYDAIVESLATIKPDAIGIEIYVVRPPADAIRLSDAIRRTKATGDLALLDQAVKEGASGHIGLGAAAKTLGVWGVALGAAFATGAPVYSFSPSDLKVRFGSRKGASKEEVGAGLERLVEGLADQMREKVPQKSLREHAWDAVGHALLASDELAVYRRDARLAP